MKVNSVRALKLSAIVPRILNRKRSFHFWTASFLVFAVAVYLYLMNIFCDILFSPIFFKVKSMITGQMFFED